MRHFRKDLHQVRGLVSVDQLNEADHLRSEIGSDEAAAFAVGGVISFCGLEILSVVPELFTLTNGRLIVDPHDTVNKFVGKI